MLDKFQITPFSILDTRSKDWKQRKRWWINKYNIQSELGREDTKSSVSLWNDNSVSIFDAEPVWDEQFKDWREIDVSSEWMYLRDSDLLDLNKVH